MKSLTCSDIFQTLKKNLIWVLLIIMIAQVSVWFYQSFIHVKEYRSEMSLLVNVEQKNDTANLQEGTRNNIQLITTFSSVLKSSKITDLVSAKTKDSQKGKPLAKNLTISSDQNSLVFRISYTDSSKERVDRISQGYLAVVEKEMPKLFKGSTVVALEKPETHLIKQGYIMNLIAFFVSLILAAVLILVLTIMDYTIKTKEQIIKLGVTCLGDIPLIRE
ncbi:YveK family protein [Listeria sp. PSOL-1]|uniref:YveK family protein n=1 Tax=Listeria sp. PSOL-1 TaxID=1844999 RepID=UPI001E361B1A|nr:Wzz/FepE/Etk N-terminal domain-containing protein [Listeria sp. PSOL-1]